MLYRLGRPSNIDRKFRLYLHSSQRVQKPLPTVVCIKRLCRRLPTTTANWDCIPTPMTHHTSYGTARERLSPCTARALPAVPSPRLPSVPVPPSVLFSVRHLHGTAGQEPSHHHVSLPRPLLPRRTSDIRRTDTTANSTCQRYRYRWRRRATGAGRRSHSPSKPAAVHVLCGTTYQVHIHAPAGPVPQQHHKPLGRTVAALGTNLARATT